MVAGKFVSVVEYDEVLREGLIGLVRSLGHAARGYASAEEYLAVQDGLCACVITDLQAPTHDALDMVTKLRRMGFDIPVIMIAEQSGSVVANDIEADPVFLLYKPFEADALADCLRHVLGDDWSEVGPLPRLAPGTN